MPEFNCVLQTLIGSATLNGAWHELVTNLACYRLWGCECSV